MRFYFFIYLFFFVQFINAQTGNSGIKDEPAPALEVSAWIDKNGKETQLPSDYTAGKVTFILCFQHWCPGCHSHGFPTLKYLYRTYKNYDDVAFLAVQTVFEGQKVNNFKKLRKTQKKYALPIPFGHDTGKNMGRESSNIMHNFKTGGTPWVIIIDKFGKVIYNDFDIEPKYANRIIQSALRVK